MSLDPKIDINWDRVDRDVEYTDMHFWDHEEGHVIEALQEALAECGDLELLYSYAKSRDYARIGELIGPLAEQLIDNAWNALHDKISEREETWDDYSDLMAYRRKQNN